MKNFITIALVLIVTKGFAKTNIQPSSLNCSGYVETYYTYDFSNPSNYNRTVFIYSFNRYNEVNLNLGFVKTACDYFMQDSIMWQIGRPGFSTKDKTFIKDSKATNTNFSLTTFLPVSF